MMQHPPSGFWIVDETVAGIPLAWGEQWPTSAVVRSTPVMSVLQARFEELWQATVPVRGGEQPGNPLLMLMSQGSTLEGAVHALGISARTGRRRITAAMEYFGVSGSVTLGVAWSIARQDHQ